MEMKAITFIQPQSLRKEPLEKKKGGVRKGGDLTDLPFAIARFEQIMNLIL
jgi:hypothetical protein